MPPSAVRRDERALHLVLGYFDPFTAQHARALMSLPAEHQIIVSVCDPPDREPLMDAAGRAQVVAAIARVSSVLTGERIEADIVTDLRSQDHEWSQALRERVLRKHAPV